VGVGGEDRREVSNCGVDPATRGARMDECLTVVRQLLTGAAVTFHGAFIDVDEAMISPRPRRSRSSSAAVRMRRSGGWGGWAMAGSACGTLLAGSPPRPG
jgi:alkanesulfonate monooxygenase SsuD/methylene tetrahydromethanopterin reductase-like flavin-dependent oxidoreductase (luciferase family)